jgi:hypothetical protein
LHFDEDKMYTETADINFSISLLRCDLGRDEFLAIFGAKSQGILRYSSVSKYFLIGIDVSAFLHPAYAILDHEGIRIVMVAVREIGQYRSRGNSWQVSLASITP